MPSRKTSVESNLAQAAEQASLVIRDLQSRLQQRPAQVEENPNEGESPEDLERELQEYFEQAAPLAEIRSRVVEGIVERILKEWDHGAALESEVVDRLIARVLERYAR